jgi:hypothetical protein
LEIGGEDGIKGVEGGNLGESETAEAYRGGFLIRGGGGGLCHNEGAGGAEVIEEIAGEEVFTRVEVVLIQEDDIHRGEGVVFIKEGNKMA